MGKLFLLGHGDLVDLSLEHSNVIRWLAFRLKHSIGRLTSVLLLNHSLIASLVIGLLLRLFSAYPPCLLLRIESSLSEIFIFIFFILRSLEVILLLIFFEVPMLLLLQLLTSINLEAMGTGLLGGGLQEQGGVVLLGHHAGVYCSVRGSVMFAATQVRLLESHGVSPMMQVFELSFRFNLV